MTLVSHNFLQKKKEEEIKGAKQSAMKAVGNAVETQCLHSMYAWRLAIRHISDGQFIRIFFNLWCKLFENQQMDTENI